MATAAPNIDELSKLMGALQWDLSEMERGNKAACVAARKKASLMSKSLTKFRSDCLLYSKSLKASKPAAAAAAAEESDEVDGLADEVAELRTEAEPKKSKRGRKKKA